jgi:hypothetical protein
MSISNALHFSPAGRSPLRHGAALPSLTVRQEHGLIMTAMAVFLAGGASAVLFALSTLGQ